MNNRKNKTGDSTNRNNDLEAKHREGRKGEQEIALDDLEPRSEIKGGSLPDIHKVTDVTLKRGSGG